MSTYAKVAAFSRGLRTKKLNVLSVALVSILGILVGFEWLLSAGLFSSISEERLVLTRSGHFAETNLNVARVRRNTLTEQSLFLLGGSSIRECFYSRESMEDELRSDLQKEIRVVNLGFPDQSFGQSLKIFDVLSKHSSENSVFIVGISARRFIHGPKKYAHDWNYPKVWAKSDSLHLFMRENMSEALRPQLLLPGALSFVHQYLWHHRDTFFQGKLPKGKIKEHYFSKITAKSELRKRELMSVHAEEVIPAFFQNFELNLNALHWLIRLAKWRGRTLVLVNTPLNPIAERLYQRVSARYKSAVSRLANQYAVPYWDSPPQLNFGNLDFRDLIHLVGHARKRYQTEVLNFIGHKLVATTGALKR